MEQRLTQLIDVHCHTIALRQSQLEDWCWGGEPGHYMGVWEPYDAGHANSFSPSRCAMRLDKSDDLVCERVLECMRPKPAVRTLRLLDLLPPPGLSLARIAATTDAEWDDALDDPPALLDVTVAANATTLPCPAEPCPLL